jgi:hypothetical protein
LAVAALAALALLPSVTASAAPVAGRRAGTDALPLPRPLSPFPGTALAGQGRWSPVGRLVDGRPVIYETTLEPPQDPGAVAGVAWMDTKLLRPVLYSGSLSPGGYGRKYTAPVQGSAARALVAAFNGGFQFPSTDGGYFSEAKMVFPLRVGAASLVIYKNGAAMVGEWGRDARMTPNVVAVRQNLNLLVDHGQAVPGLDPNDIWTWGPLGGYPQCLALGPGRDGQRRVRLRRWAVPDRRRPRLAAGASGGDASHGARYQPVLDRVRHLFTTDSHFRGLTPERR